MADEDLYPINLTPGDSVKLACGCVGTIKYVVYSKTLIYVDWTPKGRRMRNSTCIKFACLPRKFNKNNPR